MCSGFKHNLLSVNRLCCDENYNAIFYTHYCIIQDKNSNEFMGISKGENGRCCLIDKLFLKTQEKTKAQTLNITCESRRKLCDKVVMLVNTGKKNTYSDY